MYKEVEKIKRKYSFYEEANLFDQISFVCANTQSKSYLGKLNELTATLTKLKILLTDMPDLPSYINISTKELTMSEFETHVNIFYDWSLTAFNKINEHMQGHKITSIPKYVIFKLAEIYHNGTGNKPTCGWVNSSDDAPDGRYTGDFYEFLLDLEPVLKSFNIRLGTEKTIGAYAVRTLREYKSKNLTKLDKVIEEIYK